MSGKVFTMEGQVRQSDIADELAERMYRNYFGDQFIAQVPLPKGSDGDKSGTDRIIILATAEIIRVDEKKDQHRNANLPLEFLSSSSTGTPGWVSKSFGPDFFNFVFINEGWCYLVDRTTLRRAWMRKGREWRAIYGDRASQNPGYQTVQVPVPIDVVRAELDCSNAWKWR